MDEKTLMLESAAYRTDAMKQNIPAEPVRREVFCQVKNVTRAEWTNAAKLGLKAQWCVEVWADEYNGEEKAVLDGVPYAIYRTYWDGGDRMELYLGRKVGAG